jgi:hypothetical protein
VFVAAAEAAMEVMVGILLEDKLVIVVVGRLEKDDVVVGTVVVELEVDIMERMATDVVGVIVETTGLVETVLDEKVEIDDDREVDATIGARVEVADLDDWILFDRVVVDEVEVGLFSIEDMELEVEVAEREVGVELLERMVVDCLLLLEVDVCVEEGVTVTVKACVVVSALTSTIEIVVSFDFVTVAVGGTVVSTVTVVGPGPLEFVSLPELSELLESEPELALEDAAVAVEDPPSTGTTEYVAGDLL